MAYTTINKSSDYFNTKLWTGTGSTNALTGVGFQPDWTWIKQRGGTTDHHLYDAVRGVTKAIASNNSDAETTKATGLTAFGSDGFTLGGDAGVNGSSNTYVGWSWKAGNSAGSANTDGSISSTVSANTTAGFSIVKYTGTGNSNETVGHGLSQAPELVFIKNLTTAQSLLVSTTVIDGSYDYLFLNTTAAKGDSSFTAPTSSIINLNSSSIYSNTSGEDVVNYCFHSVKGFSKFGSYTGNGSNDGAFCYTGFKPAFILIKSATTAMYWHIFDKTRLGYNAYNYRLNPNANEVETTTTDVIDILSNGFKIRTSQQQFGTSGATYIYMAFAEAPLVGSNNVPATAR